jgi:hypothetical protein
MFLTATKNGVTKKNNPYCSFLTFPPRNFIKRSKIKNNRYLHIFKNVIDDYETSYKWRQSASPAIRCATENYFDGEENVLDKWKEIENKKE